MLDKKYDHKTVEEAKYDMWLKEDLFKAGDDSKKPFTIVIPPPNVTGKLHLGHAWDTTLQDIIIRYKRMDGYDALWLPGMDHAGIATQAKVDQKLKEMGIIPREIKREEWLKHAWAWKDEYAKNIHEQWAKLGLSLDYSKERFTLDDGLSDAVKHVFISLYEKGLIYRGERIINFDPDAMTALSNEEVIYKEVEGAFYHIKYMIEDSNDYLEVATTRPETLFGDTAVAVNPKDERYKHLIGKNVILPIASKLIPIIGDYHADMEFGTGVVKITPAHDPNDFEVGNRHNLERIKCINPNGTMNEVALKYNGMDRFDARSMLVKDLEEAGLLIKVEKIMHSVGHSERTNVAIEPYLSKQWFVKMDELAAQVLSNQKTDGKVNFVPKRFEKIMTHWMENCHDWCISRQLWWGHRIPAWYKNEEIYVGYDNPGEDWVQDSDVLDTWFSSALWPFSTLGWPNDLNMRYFPNDVLVTGYDIIFFWVCRMAFTSLEFTKMHPFNECLIHGLIRDKNGRKMSKSLGNGIDPMDVIDMYGADSLRYFLASSSAPGMDLRYDDEKVKSTWNFINKIWNASRFVLMNLEDFTKENYSLGELDTKDKWFLTKLNTTVKDVRKYMEKYEFHTVGSILHSFIWDDYCSSYIELSKGKMNNGTKSVLYYGLLSILKMLHPLMPYVTEEIYQMLPFKDKVSLMIEEYPMYNKNHKFITSYERIEDVLKFVNIVRNKKQENNILNSSSCVVDITIEEKDLIVQLLKLNEVDSKFDDITGIDIKYEDKYGNLYRIKYEASKNDRVEDIEKEIELLKKSILKREVLLANENYVSKAPIHIVEMDKEKLEKEKSRLELLEKKN